LYNSGYGTLARLTESSSDHDATPHSEEWGVYYIVHLSSIMNINVKKGDLIS